jgi:hypothetical protein
MSTNYSYKKKENYDDEFEKKTSGITESLWYDEIQQQQPMKFDKLRRNISHSESVDISIVGGGIVGLSTAYLLSKS